MRLKFAAASATGRTRCGELVDQKGEHKPIARDQRPETSGRKMEERRFPTSSFCLPWRADSSRRSSNVGGSLVRSRLTFRAAAFHVTLK
jgi:hypothetical protein